MMEIQETDGMMCGVINNIQVTHIEYKTIGYKSKSLYIDNVYTIGIERGNGYASQLLEHLIKKYGDKMDIKLSCHPYGVSFLSDEFGKKYKDLQEKTAKWYEKFGFVTFSREEYESSYKWIMIRKKNNIIT